MVDGTENGSTENGWHREWLAQRMDGTENEWYEDLNSIWFIATKQGTQ